MEKIRIAIPMFVFQKTGGMRVITKLAEEWTSQGIHVDFIIADSSKPYFPVTERIRVVNLKITSKIKRFQALTEFIISNFDDYDILLATQNATTIPIYMASKYKNDYSKGWYYIQAYEPEFYKIYSIKDLIKKIIANKSYSFPLKKIVNADIYKNYKNLRTDKVVYPGIDLKLYHPKRLSFFNNTVRIGTIGRVEEWKGTADVCKAMEILKSDGFDFDFYIAFNDYDTIPHYFVRPDGDENLSAFYRDMDIVVAACKGQYGAIHYPVIETMAVGTSIVCTDYYPSSEENAYKVDGSSPRQIAEAIKHIIYNKEEAINKRVQALRDVQQFGWPVIAQKFLDYLKEDEI